MDNGRTVLSGSPIQSSAIQNACSELVSQVTLLENLLGISSPNKSEKDLEISKIDQLASIINDMVQKIGRANEELSKL